MDLTKATIHGHIIIKDKNTKEVLVDKSNAIHFENMSIALARSLANRDNGPIESMAFGNGGSSVDALGVITYLEPNTIGQNATLYNETYSKIIDDNSPSNLDPITNNMAVEHEDTRFYSDVVCTCTLDYAEPSGQSAFDDETTFDTDYVFDELGLKTSDDLLLTHVIFHPVQKSLNRVIEVIYTLRIALS